MTPTIWDSFSSDYRENCLSWQHPDRPLLPPGGPDWRSRWTANPDILDVDGRRLVYFRGNGTLANDEHLHDRLGVAELVADTDTDGVLGLRHLAGDRPVVDVGAPGSFDDQHVLDPAAVQFGGRIFLYYSAVGTGPDSIGLAVSDDGERFDKVGRVLRRPGTRGRRTRRAAASVLPGPARRGLRTPCRHLVGRFRLRASRHGRAGRVRPERRQLGRSVDHHRSDQPRW